MVGGGRIAKEKLQRLLDFTCNITVIASNISEDTRELAKSHRLKFIERHYEKGDVEGFDIVIVAVDDVTLQKEIYEECRAHRILCNSVDSVDYCDFIFPSYIKKGPLTIAFSTSGISPSVAKYLRKSIEKAIPDSIVEFLEEMKELRSSLPKGKERMKMLDEKARAYIEKIFSKDRDV